MTSVQKNSLPFKKNIPNFFDKRKMSAYLCVPFLKNGKIQKSILSHRASKYEFIDVLTVEGKREGENRG
jgi:hypothetical protein